jgi:hypothetical protein
LGGGLHQLIAKTRKCEIAEPWNRQLAECEAAGDATGALLQFRNLAVKVILIQFDR